MHNFRVHFLRLVRVFLSLTVMAVPWNFALKWVCVWTFVSSKEWKFFKFFSRNSYVLGFLKKFEKSFFKLLRISRKIIENCVNSFFHLMTNTKGSLCAKFRPFSTKFETFMEKKPQFGCFWPFFLLFKPKNHTCC